MSGYRRFIAYVYEYTYGKKDVYKRQSRCRVSSELFESEPDIGKFSPSNISARPLMLIPPIPIK